MTREDVKNLKPFQIVRYNANLEDLEATDYKWILVYCDKLAVVAQKIIWEDETGGEEIHLRFPEKRHDRNEFYESVDELMKDWESGHDITLNGGFDTSADCIDLI